MLQFNNKYPQKKQFNNDNLLNDNFEIREVTKYVINYFYKDVNYLTTITISNQVSNMFVQNQSNIELNKNSQILKNPNNLKIINNLIFKYEQESLKTDIEAIELSVQEKIINIIKKFIFVFISYTIQYFSLYLQNENFTNDEIISYMQYSSFLMLKMSGILKLNIDKNNEVIKDIQNELKEIKLFCENSEKNTNSKIEISDKFVISEILQDGGHNKFIKNNNKKIINNTKNVNTVNNDNISQSTSYSTTSSNKIIDNNNTNSSTSVSTSTNNNNLLISNEKILENKTNTETNILLKNDNKTKNKNSKKINIILEKNELNEKKKTNSDIDNIIMNLVNNDSMTDSTSESSETSYVKENIYVE